MLTVHQLEQCASIGPVLVVMDLEIDHLRHPTVQSMKLLDTVLLDARLF